MDIEITTDDIMNSGRYVPLCDLNTQGLLDEKCKESGCTPLGVWRDTAIEKPRYKYIVVGFECTKGLYRNTTIL